MDDQVNASEHLEQPLWQLVQELWAMRVREDADARGHAGTSLIGSPPTIFAGGLDKLARVAF